MVVRGSGPRWYFDTSAFVKLCTAEPESEAMNTAFGQVPTPRSFSSDLLAVEANRATRLEGDSANRRCRELLADVRFVPLGEEIRDVAAELDPPRLRSLDAIHLATALAMSGDFDAFVTYDVRQAETAAALGIPVLSPA